MSLDDHPRGPWTTRRLLAWTADHFARKGIDSPRLAAEMLLAHVLGVARLKLYMDPDRPASALERAAFRQLVERAAEHEPVDYLTGQAPFFSMLLHVDPTVLIPRPSTEALVEHVVQHARRTPGFASPVVFDLGTGSGAIAIAVARHVLNCRVVATDISHEALALARDNARRLGVADRIDFRDGDLFDALPPGQRATYLVSNPPYISDQEWDDVPPNVKRYEPERALRGGVDGLKIVRRILDGAAAHLARPGQLVMEIGSARKQAVLELAAAQHDLSNAHVLADHEGLPRVLVADAR